MVELQGQLQCYLKVKSDAFLGRGFFDKTIVV